MDRTEGQADLERVDMEAVVDIAAQELDEDELDAAITRAVGESSRAAQREIGHYVVGLIVTAILLTAALADWRLFLAAVVLGALYILPIVIAGAAMAKRMKTQEALSQAIIAHQSKQARDPQALGEEQEAHQTELERAAGLQG